MHILRILIIVILVSGCGKKPHSLEHTDKPAIKAPARFSFPVIKQLQTTPQEQSVLLSWRAVIHPDLVGYNIYKFEHGSCLRHHPINKKPVTTPSLRDPRPFRKHRQPCYAVRGVFAYVGGTCEGPLSNVVCYTQPPSRN